MQQFLATLLGGVTLGAVYAAFALALCLIWRSTRVVNFSQASMAMLTTYVALTVIQNGLSWWVGLLVAVVCGLALGALVEWVVMRPVEGTGDLNAVIVTLGLLVAFDAFAGVVFGSTYQSFPAPFSLRGIQVGDRTIPITPFDLFTLALVALMMALLVALFRYTDLGLKMRAAAFAPEVARLQGVRVGRMLTLGWALAGAVGAVSGLLIASGGLVHPTYMHPVVVFGFVAAVLGGLDSPAGAVVGGVLLGVALSFVSGYLGSELVAIAALLILIVVLVVRPGGLFSHVAERRV